jgi:hypothetical protein
MEEIPKFFWWHGFVEDVDDPLKMGRCRVRIVGLHTESKQQIPTNSLPWAHPIMPYNSASSSGVGISPTGILPGTWVLGFFRDGDNCQQPMILGTYGGINKLSGITSKNPSLGFNDPTDQFPKKLYLQEPDTNKLARNEGINDTIVKKKKDDLDDCNPTALGGNWSEPPTPYDAKYPKNHVTESESGHVFEIDDTPGKERIHQYHRSGTFEEIHPDGSKVEKTVGDDYLIIRKNNNISIYGNMNVNIGDTLKLYTGKGIDIQVAGNARIHVKGNSTVQTDGNYLHKVGGSSKIISGGNMTLVAPRIDLNPSGVSPGSSNPGFKLNKSCPKSKENTSNTPKVLITFEDGTTMEVEVTRKFRTANRGMVAATDLQENDEIISLS